MADMVGGGWHVQFTELNKQEQLAKLAEARQAAKESPMIQKYKFVSALNEQVGCFRELSTRTPSTDDHHRRRIRAGSGM